VDVLLVGVAVGAAYSLMAVGVVLIYRCTRALSIAQGEIGAFALYVGLDWHKNGVWLVHWHISAFMTLVVAVVGGAAIAVAFERLVMRALVARPALDSLIATLGLALVLALAELKIFGTNPQDPGHPIGRGSVTVLGATLVYERIGALILAVVTVVAIAVFFRKTKFGLAVLATTSDPTVAKVLGVPVNRVYVFAWVVGGVLSGLAASLLAPAFGVLVPFGQTKLALAALAGAVIGGLDSIEGAILGSLIVGIVESEVGTFFDPGSASLAIALLVLGTLLARPQGLLGREALT
jgi:branched-chain amino acid transport system permease protein